LQFVNHLEHRPPGLAFRLCASTDHFSRAEDQGRSLRLLQPVDQAWELFRAVLYPWKNPYDRVEVYPLVQRRRSDNVLDIDKRLTLIRQEPQAPALGEVKYLQTLDMQICAELNRMMEQMGISVL